jgi:aarF domain-containing kinase
LPKHTSNTQEVDSHLPKGQINSDSFYSAGPPKSIPSVEAVPVQDEIPEGVDTALFYSPRVARLLGGKPQGYKQGGLELKGVKDTPVDHTDLAANKDQDSFNIRTSSDNHPTVPDDGADMHTNSSETATVSKVDIEDLAQDISQDTNSSRVKVRFVAPKTR